MMELFLIGAALFVAFSNGANDNFKGFATVWGSQALSYRAALMLATVATVAGALASVFLAEGLVQQFSGKGLVPDAVAAAPQFIVSVAVGAAATVFLATRTGFPVSTTHALIGGLVGAGLGLPGGEVHYAKLADSFLMPLLVSPLVAAFLAAAAFRLLRRAPVQAECACLVGPALVTEPNASGAAMLASAAPTLVMGSAAECDRLPPLVARISMGRIADRVHILSAALICFARGVNDTPKLAALLLAAHMLDTALSIPVIAAIMAVGGLLYARRVAEKMSLRMARLDNGQGLAANLVTAGLVLFASKLGLPVSTTHVAVGAIAGAGAGARTLDWPTVRGIALSWAATLPVAAAVAWAAASALRAG